MSYHYFLYIGIPLWLPGKKVVFTVLTVLHLLTPLWSPALVLPVAAVFFSIVLALLTKSPAVAAGATCLMVLGVLLCFAMGGVEGYGLWGWGTILLSGAAAWGVRVLL